MGHLLNVRDRAATTDEMFEPLKQTIDLLKSYDHEMSEEVHQQLQVCRTEVLTLGINAALLLAVVFMLCSAL